MEGRLVEFKIEKGIPLPKRGNNKPNQWKALIESIPVGESMFFEGYTTRSTGGPYRSATFMQQESRGDMQFSGKTVTEGGIEGVRIRRVR